MASLKILDKGCAYHGCASRATHEIINEHDEQEGVYCTRHAGVRLREVEADERAKAGRSRKTAVES